MKLQNVPLAAPMLPLFAIGEIRDRHSCLRGLGFEFGRVVAMVV